MRPMLHWLLKAISIGLLLFSHQVLATNCYEQSPYFGEDYYNLENAERLTFQQKNDLSQFLSSMGGRWEGHLQYIECRGPDSAPRTIVKHAKLNAKNKYNAQGGLSMQVEKNYTDESIKKLETLNLIGNGNIFNFDISPNTQLTYSEKYRRQNNVAPKADKTKPSSNNQTIIDKTADANKQVITTYQKEKKKKTSRITETIYDITFNSGLLTITRAYYTNGVYTGKEIWQLSPN